MCREGKEAYRDEFLDPSGHDFLNADWADQADENRIRIFKDLSRSFSCSLFVWLVYFVVSFLESWNHETHETHEKEHETKIPFSFQIRMNPPDPPNPRSKCLDPFGSKNSSR